MTTSETLNPRLAQLRSQLVALFPIHKGADRADLAAAGGGAALAGPMITTAGTQAKGTFRAIGLVKQLKAIDARLTAEVGPDMATRTIRLDGDDIVVDDPVTGTELGRHAGHL
ncbi:MAG TPA: hypothetical protein VGB79_10375 [Allosphingosinicella sp.]|jgi:hypothetical protein